MSDSTFVQVAAQVCGLILVFLVSYGPEAEGRDFRKYANTEDPDHPAHPRSLVSIFAVRLHKIRTLLKT